MTDEEETNMADAADSTNLPEFRDMVAGALSSNVAPEIRDEHAEANIDSALLCLDPHEDVRRRNPLDTATAVSVTELPSGVADSLNDAAKRLSFLYDSVLSNGSTEAGEELVEDEDQDDNHGSQLTDYGIPAGVVQPVEEQATAPSAVPKPVTNATTTSSTSPQKRHIMISYNQSSRATCERIYHGLVAKNYKVWMDLTDMMDNILSGMAQAVENSYIVLICINQRNEVQLDFLEAEYAQENRIKFIPCLMEKDFRPRDWLGIIKGANMHVDFSSPEDFDKSFNDLIRQINSVERKLALQPRQTPAPGPMINPMLSAATSTASPASPSATATFSNDINARRFDAIIREYKQSIRKKSHNLSRLKRNELSELIFKLRQELFSETSQVLSDSDRSDDDDEKSKNDDQLLRELLNRSLDQNEVLLRLVDRLATPQPMEATNRQQIDMDGIIKVILAIMLLWTLNIICQKE